MSQAKGGRTPAHSDATCCSASHPSPASYSEEYKPRALHLVHPPHFATCVEQKEETGPSIATERQYIPQEVAAIWNVSVDTVIRRFRSKPGVIEIGNDETLHKRRKTLMRIPESVVERIHESHRSKSPRRVQWFCTHLQTLPAWREIFADSAECK